MLMTAFSVMMRSAQLAAVSGNEQLSTSFGTFLIGVAHDDNHFFAPWASSIAPPIPGTFSPARANWRDHLSC